MSTGERVCWILTLLGAGMVTAPFMFEEALEPMGDARFAMVIVGALIGLTSFICVFLFRSRNRVRRQLLAGRDLLAHWTYTEAEWRAFAGGEVSRQASGKRALLWITAVIMIVVTLGFTALDRRAGPIVGIVLFVVWILCWLAARLGMKAQAKRAAGPVPEVRLGADGLLLGDEFHVWRGWGGRVDKCELIEGPPKQMSLTYSMPARHGRDTTEVRVPIPAGKEAEAVEVCRRLQR